MSHPEHERSSNAVVLLRESEVPAMASSATFRYSRPLAALVAGVVVAASGALVAIGYLQDNPFAYYVAALLLVFLWIYQTLVIARFRSTNWLIRLTDHGLYIKFRSYLNHHFPVDDRTVVYVPFSAVRGARHVREAQELPDPDGRGTVIRRRSIIELELKEGALHLEQALAAERRAKAPGRQRWYGSSAGKYRHHPVRMATATTLAMEWGVRPRITSFLSAMAVHTTVESAIVKRDYTGLGRLEREAQESRLLELAENGQMLDAVQLARIIYGYDLSQARRFVEDLAGRAKA